MQQGSWRTVLGLGVVSAVACGSAPAEADDEASYRILAFVSPTGSGSVAFVPDRPAYAAGDHVLLRAQPSNGNAFVRYSGGLSSDNAETNVVIDGDLTLTAQFGPEGDEPSDAAMLEIINDLPGGKDADGNWSRMNTLVRLTIDATELLTEGDASCDPTSIAVGGTRTFEVDGPDYDLTVQTGAWEYDPFFTGCWDLYLTAVHDCGGGCCEMKRASTRVTSHTGKKTVRLSSLLPAKTWEGSAMCGTNDVE
ncbi:MAG: hypothetical protein ACAI38_11220 [Myxococcota bacterium]|nr:hypothetical protein [Myxococcota bacterium]